MKMPDTPEKPVTTEEPSSCTTEKNGTKSEEMEPSSCNTEKNGTKSEEMEPSSCNTEKNGTKSEEMEPVHKKIELKPEDLEPVNSNPAGEDMSYMSLSDIIKLNKFKLKEQQKQDQALKGTQGGKVQKKAKKKKVKKQNQQQKNPTQQQQQKKQKQKPNQQQKQQIFTNQFNQQVQSQQQLIQGLQRQMYPVQNLLVNQMSTMSTLPSGPGRLVLKNLDIGVTDQDIYDLFSEFGEVTDASIHYDRFGKSLGSAHVSFKRYIDAVKGQKKYHGMALDGRAMVINVEQISDIEKQQSISVTTGISTKKNRKKAVKRLQTGPLATSSYSQYVRPLSNQQNVSKPLNVGMSCGIFNQFSMGYANPGYGLDMNPMKSENLFGSMNRNDGMSTSVLSRVSSIVKNTIQYNVMDRIDYGAGPSAGNLNAGNIGGQLLVQGNQQPKKKKRKPQQQRQAQGGQNQQGGAQKGNQSKSSKKKKKQQQKAKPLTAELLDKEMDEYLKTIHVS